MEIVKEELKTKLDAHLRVNSHYTQTQTAVLESMLPFLGSAAGSVMAQSFVVPIDVVTQRLMVDETPLKADVKAGASTTATPKRQSAMDIVRQTIRREGLRGMYRGYSMAVISYVPTSSLVWGGYAVLKNTLREQFVDKKTGDSQKRWGSTTELLFTPLAGFTAASTAALITNPLDILRTRIQVNETNIGIRGTFSKLIAEHGVKGLWLGVGPRMVSMGSSSAVVFCAYELVKRAAAN
jgi:solute carrier family 25 protein 44